MALLIAIASHRMWMAVLLDTRLMLVTFLSAPSSRVGGGQRQDRALLIPIKYIRALGLFY